MTKAQNPDQPQSPKSSADSAATKSASATSDAAQIQPGSNVCCGICGLLTAGLLGGLLGGAAMSRYSEHFEMVPVSAEMDSIARADSQDPRLEPYFRQRFWDPLWKNVALSFGLIGIAIGGVMGLTVGLGRKSLLAAIAGLCLGGVLGGLFGAGGGWASAAAWEHLHFNYLRGLKPGPDQVRYGTYVGMAAHAVAWAVLGVGLASVVSLMASKRVFVLSYKVAGLFAGLIAAALYAPLASMIFPMVQSDLPIPEGAGNQIFFTMLAGGLFGLALGRVAAPGKQAAASHP